MTILERSPVFVAIALYCILAEMLWRTRGRGARYDFADAAASFGVFLGKTLAGGLNAAVVIPAYLWLASVAPATAPIEDWRVWALCFVAMEFVYYWQHRLSHTVRWLWANHAVHHTAEQFSLPAAIRLGWMNGLSGAWLFYAPLILLGFPPTMIVILLAANLQYQFFLHTEEVGRLGVLERVFNTPAHHRVHHASNPEYRDRNFGGVLIIFDRLFGTFAEATDAGALRYGLVRPVTSKNPVVIAFAEWGRMLREAAAARRPAAFFRVLFGRP